jgi:hypothetical protein
MKKIILTIAFITYSSTAITAMNNAMTRTYNTLFPSHQGRVAPEVPLPVATPVSYPIPHAILIPMGPIVVDRRTIPARIRNQHHPIVVVFNSRQGEQNIANPIDNYVPARQLPRELLQDEEHGYTRQRDNVREEFNRIRDILQEQESIQPDEDRRKCCSIS